MALGVGAAERHPAIAEFGAALEQGGRAAAKPDGYGLGRARIDPGLGDPMVVAFEAEGVLAPQAAHQADLLGLALAAVAEVLVQGFVLHGVPARADAEAQPIVRQQRHFRRLLGHQGCLPLGQYQHRGDQLQAGGHGSDEGIEGERLVEGDVLVVGAAPAAGPIRVGPQHMVVDQQMGDA